MKQKEQLSGFLIRRLIVVLLFIAISQSLISLLFTTVFYPFINAHFHIDILNIVNATRSSPITIVVSLFWFAGSAFVNLIPEMLRTPLQVVLNRLASHSWEDYLSQIPAQNRTKTLLLLVLILLVGLILYLVPYLFATVLYSRWVVQEVGELRKHDAREREVFEQQRNLLLSDIAHDLKTPITTISGYADALKNHMVTDSDKQEEYLTAISSKSIQMSGLINLLFQYVTLDSEGFRLKCEKLNLSEVIMETVAANYSDLEAVGFELVMDIPELPIITSVDVVQMSRALTNLIQNAIRHNPEYTVLLIAVENLYDRVSVDVADSGVRIEADICDHLFDPFVMADESRVHRGGSGLGLSIASKIIELHGGSITLLQPYEKVAEGRGYTKAFHIEIPL